MNNEYELCHYGVKGMKWGVRRAQRKLNKAARTADKQAKRHRNLANNYKRIFKDLQRGDYKKLGYPSVERAKRDIPLTAKMIRSETKLAKHWTKTRNEIMKMSVNDVSEAKRFIEIGKQYTALMDDMIYARIERESKKAR